MTRSQAFCNTSMAAPRSPAKYFTSERLSSCSSRHCGLPLDLGVQINTGLTVKESFHVIQFHFSLDAEDAFQAWVHLRHRCHLSWLQGCRAAKLQGCRAIVWKSVETSTLEQIRNHEACDGLHVSGRRSFEPTHKGADATSGRPIHASMARRCYRARPVTLHVRGRSTIYDDLHRWLSPVLMPSHP